jgi:hypothetical protein
MTNVPAFREEPLMLPEYDVRSWIYIYYSANMARTTDEYWKVVSMSSYEAWKSLLNPNDEVKKVAAELTAGAATDDEKLRKIYDYVKSQIKNLNYVDKPSDDDWKKVREAKTPGDTLKLKMAGGGGVNSLFGAMARAVGLDARYALLGNRSEMIFDPRVANRALMIDASCIAIKVAGEWRLFSPSLYYTPYGMIAWTGEGQAALITDPKEAVWLDVKLSDADKSKEKRTGKFKLLDDGSLEGEARIEYTGHWGASVKSINRGDTADEQEKTLKNLIKANIGDTAEVLSYTVENVNERDKPFVYTFKIRVPNYAIRTGKRIFLQPNVFERNSKPRFISNTRKYDVYFNYPYSESDEITIELPPGFALENADAPIPIKDQQGIGSHVINMGITQDGRSLVYRRNFSFGNNGFIRFPAKSYPAIKGLFEAFNKADIHQLTLREGTTAVSK